jgi:hypothetical protein
MCSARRLGSDEEYRSFKAIFYLLNYAIPRSFHAIRLSFDIARSLLSKPHRAVLTKAGIGTREIDKYVNYLTELSYFLFRTENRTLSESEFDVFANEYSRKYLIASHNDVVAGLLKSGILNRDDDRNLQFRYKYIYYFCCAKYMSDNYLRTEVKDIVARLKHIFGRQCEHYYLYVPS